MEKAYSSQFKRPVQSHRRPNRRRYGQRVRVSDFPAGRKFQATSRPPGTNTGPTDDGSLSRNGETTHLFEQLSNPAYLREAFNKLKHGRTVAARQFRGAADRVSIEFYERNLDQRLQRLTWKLGSGSYRPYPVNQFWQAKPNGGQRLLNVFTVEDRLVQRAVLNLLEPHWEPVFLPCSYAFRPERSLRDALLQLEQAYSEGYRWVADADIESFFDRIPRGRLLALLAGKIKDSRLMALQSLLLDYTPTFVPNPKKEVATHSHHLTEIRPAIATKVEPSISNSKQPSSSVGGKPLHHRFGRLSRRALENGLDWSIARLEGEGSGPDASPYNYRASGIRGGSVAGSSWADGFDYDEEEAVADYSSKGSFAPTRYDAEEIYPVSSEDEKGWSKSALRRIGMDSTLLGLSLARKAVKHGLPHLALPGQLGLVVKTGLALGAASSAGAWALKRWRHQPTLYQIETAIYHRTDGQPDAATQWLAADPQGGMRGIAQGSILSPFYSNVYLHEFDQALSARGYRLVRFADDLVILCRSQREAFEALAVAEAILARLGLNFKPAKTRVCPLAEGFRFLGAELGPHGRWKKWPDMANLAVFPGTGEARPAATGWLSRARKGWLRPTSRTRPGPVQQGRSRRTLVVRDETERTAEGEIGETQTDG